MEFNKIGNKTGVKKHMTRMCKRCDEGAISKNNKTGICYACASALWKSCPLTMAHVQVSLKKGLGGRRK